LLCARPSFWVLAIHGMSLKDVARVSAQDKLLGRLALRRGSCVPA
jgi:hypothetical protein